jgi:uncharacterized membrane protein SirB2
MDYALVKLVHQGAVTLSLTGFFVRGAASLAGAHWVQGRAAKTLPHVVDSVLLLSALTLTWMLRLDPGHAPWLLAKIIGLVVKARSASSHSHGLGPGFDMHQASAHPHGRP